MTCEHSGSRGFDDLDPVIQHHVVNTLGWSSLRPLQEESIRPIQRGDDVLLLAPTAGGKTEAALFPLLTRMSRERWRGTSVLYVCPLKALLNNIHLRAVDYTAWLGRTAALRHGDVGASARRRQIIDRPDVLLTTPESIESMLVSAVHDPRDVFRDVHAVVVDEVHAFAGDDRGWHLLAVLERVARVAGRPLQRIGCSATVGNAPDLLAWLQGGNRSAGVSASVVAPSADVGAASVDVALDYVGNLANAAEMTSRLHVAEKRLLFADSRRSVESLAVELRERNVTTFVSHSSLSLDERRRAEAAFADARDCVIVSTSTLELGIDVGDLDRVLQYGSPSTVASFLQRLGRTGRRPGTVRNTLFLEPDDDSLLRAAGLLLLWSEGYVEPTVPPPRPLHIVAQQVIAQALQRSQVTSDDAWEPLADLGMATRAEFDVILDHLHTSSHLDCDGGLYFVGPAAEREFGRKNFLDLLAVFSAPPEIVVLQGREEIGSVDPVALSPKADGPTILSLAGRSWKVNAVDWARRRAYVEPSQERGRSQWSTVGGVAYSSVLCGAMRRVLAGEDPAGVTLTKRALQRLDYLRTNRADQVCPDPVVLDEGARTVWWTWAGIRENARRAAAFAEIIPALVSADSTVDNLRITLNPGVTPWDVDAALRNARKAFRSDLSDVILPISDDALRGLKFSELLPDDFAKQVAANR